MASSKKQPKPDEWLGDHPFYLVVRVDGPKGATVIDLDLKGWSQTYRSLMREPGVWYLVNKADGRIPIALTVAKGEQPYYTARHVGIASTAPDAEGKLPAVEIVAYGLGKKRLDGHTDRIWYFQNGLAVTGDDVEAFGIESIKRGLA